MRALILLAVAILSASGVIRPLQWHFCDDTSPVSGGTSSESPQEQSKTESEAPGNHSAALGVAQLLVYIGYLSAPGNTKKRRWLRKSCFQRIRAACLRMNDSASNETSSGSALGWGTACDGGFFIGQPSDPRASSSRQGKRLGVKGTDVEIEQAKSLLEEVAEFGDVHLLPMRDMYTELPSKTYSLLRRGAESGAKLVLKIDDDHCPDMEKILSIAQETSPDEAKYLGYLVSGNHSLELERGPDGSEAPPYMNGPAYLVSLALARAVAIDNGAQSILYMQYGSSTEDANMGKWYEYAKQTHPHLKFTRETVHPVAMEHIPPPTKSEVSCGGHSAPACDKCPMGHGELWCHGHCVWSAESGVCVLRPGLAIEEY